MSLPRRKNVYKADFASMFKGVRKGKDDYHAYCIPCRDEINLTSMGKTAITQHQAKPKHKENSKAADTTRFFCFFCSCYIAVAFRALSNFMSSRSAPNAIDDKTAAAEGAWAFHVATHNQAFASNDCCSSDALFQTMFSDSEVAKKFRCGKDKTKAIITGCVYFCVPG